MCNLFEGHLEVLVVNAQHSKTVPGRKTDVADATWIAGLLRHGLPRPSFIPDRPQRARRAPTRPRISLIQDRAAVVNRLHKTRQGATSKTRQGATSKTRQGATSKTRQGATSKLARVVSESAT